MVWLITNYVGWFLFAFGDTYVRKFVYWMASFISNWFPNLLIIRLAVVILNSVLKVEKVNKTKTNFSCEFENSYYTLYFMEMSKQAKKDFYCMFVA